MDHHSEEDRAESAALMQSMTLLASLQTAFEVWSSVQGRRHGVDPTEQEPEHVARFYLRHTNRELKDLHRQLVLTRICTGSESAGAEPINMAAPIRRFDELTKLTRVARLLQGVHQRLMSLYPLVSEELVERARKLQQWSESLSEGNEADTLEGSDFLAELYGLSQQLKSI